MAAIPVNDTIPTSLTRIREIANKHHRQWQHIFAADQFSRERITAIRQNLFPLFDQYPDTTILAFGSLARFESTSGSDVDWAIVHDGRATQSIRFLPNIVAEQLKTIGIEPLSETSEFGKLSSSLEIIVSIASKHDVRLSLSRRMLLIFESVALAQPTLRDRLITEVLAAYRSEETLSEKSVSFVPRYLLNDLNQFWRLMCTDYSGQTRAREGKHWGLRSLKLNFSRKLLFVSGALRCFEYHLEVSKQGYPTQGPRSQLEHIYQAVRDSIELRPLEMLARHLDEANMLNILDSYEQFLTALDDPVTREHLASLKYEEADEDEFLLSLWQISRTFHDAIVGGIMGAPFLAELVKRCLIM